MIRAWMGLAMLSGSWLLGLEYTWTANPIAWAAVVAAGTLALAGAIDREPSRREAGAALAMLVPAIWFAPWPYRAAPLLMAAGLALRMVPVSRRWPRLLAGGAVTAGVVLLVQAAALLAYIGQTARSHELPRPLPQAVGAVAPLLGIDAATTGNTVALGAVRKVHHLGATWELVLPPTTFCFLLGGVAFLAVLAWGKLPEGKRFSAWLRAIRVFALLVLAWLPVRAGLMMALYLHRAAWTPLDLPLHAMNQFLNPWVQLALLAAPALLAWRFVRIRPAGAGGAAEVEQAPKQVAAQTPGWRYAAGVALAVVAVAGGTFLWHWDPVGQPLGGRVMVVERHSDWERTTKPAGTAWFGERSLYNYHGVYTYAAQYFTMSRLMDDDAIDDETLAGCDVLVIKTPTERFEPAEVAAVQRFVERGGGLLLLGEHTNYQKSSTAMNDIIRLFGFTFRNDLLLGMDRPLQQRVDPAAVPHPIAARLPAVDFAVSCSVDPGSSRGRAVVQSAGLWNMPSDYAQPTNYFPLPRQVAEIRYGAFIQVWAARQGQGRVVAFTDSTIFSDWMTYEPGKCELWVAMLNWLNCRSPWDPVWARLLLVVPLGLLGLVAVVAALWWTRRRQGAWLLLLAAGTCGWAVGSAAAAAWHRRALPPPQLITAPKTTIVIDRTVSQAPLMRGAFVRDAEVGEGYGMFEQWIPRLGYVTVRRSGPDAFTGDALVILNPSHPVSPEYRDRLVEYVGGGGKVLVIDTPENKDSTANRLLEPFGLTVRPQELRAGALLVDDRWPGLPVTAANRVDGGEPFAHCHYDPVGDQPGEIVPVGATARHGQGCVMAIGFGSLFNDASMGFTWDVAPSAGMIDQYGTYLVYNLHFAIFRALIEGPPVKKLFAGHVVLDRTVSGAPLPEDGQANSSGTGFGIFEGWFYNLGYATSRGSGDDAFAGDVLAIVHPNKEPDAHFRQRLVDYVQGGGKLLVLDSPLNEGSTANSVLSPFGLAIDHQKPCEGELALRPNDGWPHMPMLSAWNVSGGQPFAYVGGVPVGARAKHGRGEVMAVGFGHVFCDVNMVESTEGGTEGGGLVPHDLQSTLLRALYTDEAVADAVPVRDESGG